MLADRLTIRDYIWVTPWTCIAVPYKTLEPDHKRRTLSQLVAPIQLCRVSYGLKPDALGEMEMVVRLKVPLAAAEALAADAKASAEDIGALAAAAEVLGGGEVWPEVQWVVVQEWVGLLVVREQGAQLVHLHPYLTPFCGWKLLCFEVVSLGWELWGRWSRRSVGGKGVMKGNARGNEDAPWSGHMAAPSVTSAGPSVGIVLLATASLQASLSGAFLGCIYCARTLCCNCVNIARGSSYR